MREPCYPTRIRSWLRPAIAVAAIFVAWLAISVLAYNDDQSIDAIVLRARR